MFIAMQFNEPELDRVVAEFFAPAVRDTGFVLERLRPRAGLIDDQIRVDIRAARFVIADLTHDNRGAYFEAGFAEGLGRPVIYTCREDMMAFIHFDTSHLVRVPWRLDNLDAAATQLKLLIRNTLPTEAVMADPS